MLKAAIPFTKVTESVQSGSIRGVELRDSAGSAILCNFIQVYPEINGALSVTTHNLRYQVYLSGVGATVTPINANVSSTTNTSSGVLGVSKSGLGVAEFCLDHGDECSAIHLFYASGTAGPASVDFIVNYGVLKPQRNKWLLETQPNLGTK